VDSPRIAPIRQTVSQPVIADVDAEVQKQGRDSRIAGRIRRGSRVIASLRPV